MAYWAQFRHFDPLAGSVPSFPLAQLPDIAVRARVLLASRTVKQIAHVAEVIDWMVEEYFQQQKSALIQRILTNGSWVLGYLKDEARNEQGLGDLLDNWPSDAADEPPSYPNKDNTSELHALIECIDGYVITDDELFPSANEHEYFAVMALWKVADCLQSLHPTGYIRKVSDYLEKGIADLPWMKDGPVPFGITQKVVVDDLMQAQEAVLWAERMQAVQPITTRFSEVKAELAQLKRETAEQAENLAKKRISLNARKAAIVAHTENRAMKADVFKWCESNLHKFRSMDKAAEAIAGPGKLVPVANRTGRSWIAEWKKLQSARTP